MGQYFLAGTLFAVATLGIPSAVVWGQEPAEPRYEAKSRLIRALLHELSKLEEQGGEGIGTDEERSLIRRTLMQADAEISRSFGGNSVDAIRRYNNRRPPVIVRPDKRGYDYRVIRPRIRR